MKKIACVGPTLQPERQGDDKALDLRCLKKQNTALEMALTTFHVNKLCLPDVLT